mgnify:CR=1 FL=1
MIEIKITADNPMEALANLTAYGILCMESREVFDRAGACGTGTLTGGVSYSCTMRVFVAFSGGSSSFR